MQEIKIGTRFESLNPVIDDDENGQERTTPAGSIGEITSIDNCPSQGITYGFGFPSTGGTGYLLEAELRDPQQFRLIEDGAPFTGTYEEYVFYMGKLRQALEEKPANTAEIIGGNFMILHQDSLCCGARLADGSCEYNNLGDPSFDAWEESWKHQLDRWLAAPVFATLTAEEMSTVDQG